VRQVIDNPVTGERIVIRTSGADTGGELLAWEMVLSPGGRVPASHAHPEQEERFTVLRGRLALRVGGRSTTARPGDTVTVPRGTVHSFSNAGRVPVRVLVETRPALDMAALLATAAEMAKDQQARRARLPRLLDLALFMRDFEHEVRAPYLPAPAVRLVTRSATWLARCLGADTRYRRLRHP
jgi:quercetin dioxygenase-like cupin family protein